MSCHDYPLTHQQAMVGIDKYTIICQKFGQMIVQNVHPEFLLQFFCLFLLKDNTIGA
jgi:hypothetical protein